MVEIVNQMVRWDDQQCRLSPGDRILALVVSILFDRTALWRVHEVMVDQDLATLFRPGVVATDFHDDALARALDKLGQANPERVIFNFNFSFFKRNFTVTPIALYSLGYFRDDSLYVPAPELLRHEDLILLIGPSGWTQRKAPNQKPK